MNIATGIYTDAELFEALCSNTREVYYEYVIQNTQGQTLGQLPIEDGRVSFDSGNEVMRTFSGTTRASDLFNITSTDFYLIPWMCLKYKNDVVKWSLGKFLVNPSENYRENVKTVDITGYDLGKLALDDKSDARIYMEAGSVYTSFAAQIAGSVYTYMDIQSSAKIAPNPMEWEVGTDKIKILNDLMNSISYDPMYFDETGTLLMNEYVEPSLRSIERIYSDNEQSIVLDGITYASNKFEIPNKFVRYVENPDAAYLISTYVNDDPNSPYSTVSRGRTIVDAEAVSDIATQTDLDNYVRKVAMEKMQNIETLDFTTLNMPGHGFKNCLLVSIESYGVNSKYIETRWEMDLSRGGTMTHRCEKVVQL